MPGIAGASGGAIHLVAVGREGEAHRLRQAGGGGRRGRLADAEPRHEDRDAGAGAGLVGAGIDIEGAQTALADAGHEAVAALLRQARIGRRREARRVGGRHPDHHGLARGRAGRADHRHAGGGLDLLGAALRRGHGRIRGRHGSDRLGRGLRRRGIAQLDHRPRAGLAGLRITEGQNKTEGDDETARTDARHDARLAGAGHQPGGATGRRRLGAGFGDPEGPGQDIVCGLGHTELVAGAIPQPRAAGDPRPYLPVVVVNVPLMPPDRTVR